MSLEPGPDFEQLLEFLRQSRGFDFTGYKRTTLVRRVSKRARQVGVDSFTDYLDYLQVHPDEYPELFNTVLINVTEFFRDRPAWDFLAANVIPRILGDDGGRPVRVWSAGTASGEEAYSVAMLIADRIGPEEFVRRVKIYATDVDDEALAHARGGYSHHELANVPEDLVAKYFEPLNGRHVFRPALRRAIIFGRHDLVQDAPISRLDLLICRNTLMYFTAESQARMLGRFHYALREDGFLFLGRAEMLLTHRDLFAPVDLRNRVFAKVATPAVREGLYVLAEPGDTALHLAQQVRLRELAGDQVPVAQLVIDAHGTLVSANRVARRDLGIAQAEIGKPLADIEVSYRPAELVPAVRDSARQRRAIALPPVEHRLADGSRRHYHVNVIPLVDDDGADVGTVVYFTDITEYRHVSDELERSRQEIETAYEELQSSNEELETTNEELQSTVEELETTNEELQSSNEELETMNEELESTNSELQAINTDLRVRTEEIDRLNVFLESILGSVNLGVVVLDRDRRVAIWNSRATDLWGVRGDEAIGNDFFGLDIGLPLDRLAELVAGVEAGHVAEPEVVSAVNRRGREIRCRISAAPMPPASDGRGGVILLMEDIAAASAR